MKRNFHRIWIAMEEPLVKRAPGCIPRLALVENEELRPARQELATAQEQWQLLQSQTASFLPVFLLIQPCGYTCSESWVFHVLYTAV